MCESKTTEPTQQEIDGVAAVLEKAANDPIARQSAYIMAKMLKRVFVVSHTPAKEDQIRMLEGVLAGKEIARESAKARKQEKSLTAFHKEAGTP